MPDSAAQTFRLSVSDFTALCERNQWPLHTFLRGLVGDGEQARDLMQDIFLETWRAIQRGNPPFDSARDDSDARRWLFHVAYHRAISVLRRRHIVHWQPLDAVDGGYHAEVNAPPPFEDRLVESHAVREALASLSTADAACLLLIVVQGFTAAEAGQIVGASPQAVAKRFSRAKQRLRLAYLAQDSQPIERSRP